MAGAGRKTFSAGAVLTAAEVQNYLQDQAVMVFGGTAARSSAIPTPSEGMVSFRTDDNAVEYYDGASWTSALNPTVNNQTGTTYTFVATDNGKLVTASNSSSQTFTIPPQVDVAWPNGAIISVISYGTGTVTFAGGSGVTVTNAANTLSQYQGASLIRTASNAWTVVPLSGGANALSDANVTGTTGSPTTATYTSGGINYKTYSFTGSGSITLATGGLVDCLLVGGGGAGYLSQGGGGGGGLITNQIYLPAGTYTIAVGAGGTKDAMGTGNISTIGLGTRTYYNIVYGGGNGNSNSGSCGGGANANTPGTTISASLGYNGGDSGNTNNSGGGGGLGAAGNNAPTASTGAAGGAGINNDFRTGSNTAYGGGGGGGGSSTGGASGGSGGGAGGTTTVNGTNGTANTGGGGGGAWGGGSATSGNGGSGVVAIRVKA